MDWITILLNHAEAGDLALAWEDIARECLAQMSCDDAESVATALGFDIDEEIEEEIEI